MASSRWPALRWEERTWEPSREQALFRAEAATIGRAYRAALPALIADQQLSLTGPVLAQVEEATAAMARLDASFPGEVGPLASMLLRGEAVSSSQIENITASARRVIEAEVTGEGAGNAVIVADATASMRAAVDLARRLDAHTILEVQRTLLEGSAPALVGWRQEPVWIGGGTSTPVTADFVPPHHRHIPELIDDLVLFLARDDLPVLAQAALAHAQFETIHPFADGNGRVGRALVHALLRGKGVTRHLTIPVSGGLLARRDDYIGALTAYRGGDVTPVIGEFARAALHGAYHGARLLDQISMIRQGWTARLRARSDSRAWDLLDHLVTHPVLHSELAGSLLGILPGNASRLLRVLADQQILLASQHYKSRRTLYRAPEILDALDRYAEEVGRRRRS